jgi:beta-N-acetylhexosaminidase
VYFGVSIQAFVQTLLALLLAPVPSAGPPAERASPTAREKAALVVVSSLPAPRGVGGVLVRRWNTTAPRPPRALAFVDQEGGDVRAFRSLPPTRPASAYETAARARAAGRATGRALWRRGVHVDLAPVVDLASGPVGSRHFRRPELALAFARGLESTRTASCPKHFPGLGSAPVSTDYAPRVRGRVLARELAAFRRGIRAGVRCVMLSHAFYERFGGRRALTAPGAYRLLRRMGFDGVAITDSLSIVRGRWPVWWARRAALAGADMLLFTSPDDARRAIRALVPLARRGALDDAVQRILKLRRSLGLGAPNGW